MEDESELLGERRPEEMPFAPEFVIPEQPTALVREQKIEELRKVIFNLYDQDGFYDEIIDLTASLKRKYGPALSFCLLHHLLIGSTPNKTRVDQYFFDLPAPDSIKDFIRARAREANGS